MSEINMDNKIEVETCARAAHEAGRSFSFAIGEEPYPTWEECEESDRVICRIGVIGIIQYDHTLEQSHKNWVDQKHVAGWKGGPAKDVKNKIHPCLVPYDQLPPEQQIKDELFYKVVKAMASALWRRPQ
jgi:hypothetical protein